MDYCRERECRRQLYKMVVPPVWHKRGYAQRISELWEIAADELCVADKIVIIGYSLPVFDISAKHLLLLSSYLNRKVKVEIVNGQGFDEKSFKQIFKHSGQIRNTKMSFKDYVAHVRE